MKPTATAADLINKMERTHAHRALVINAEKKIERVITQTDVLRMIGRNEKLIRQATSSSLSELLMITRDVHTRPDSTSCVDLVLAMRKLDICVIGIVNEDGKLVDSFSVSDLRGVTPQILASLILPPVSFKSFLSKRILEPPVHVKEDSLFGDLITKMINSHLHVVYLVEEEKPTGIITLTDVIRTATFALPKSS
jgi:CBS-domain-containing membrane protein